MLFNNSSTDSGYWSSLTDAGETFYKTISKQGRSAAAGRRGLRFTFLTGDVFGNIGSTLINADNHRMNILWWTYFMDFFSKNQHICKHMINIWQNCWCVCMLLPLPIGRFDFETALFRGSIWFSTRSRTRSLRLTMMFLGEVGMSQSWFSQRESSWTAILVFPILRKNPKFSSIWLGTETMMIHIFTEVFVFPNLGGGFVS